MGRDHPFRLTLIVMEGGVAALGSGWEIVCPGCRSSVPSNLRICPGCGQELEVLASPLSPSSRAVAESRSAFSSRGAANPYEVFNAPGTPWLLLDDRIELRGVTFGSFWIRSIAGSIDALLLAIVGGGLYFALGTIGLVVEGLGALFYFVMMESSSSRGTLGKIVCGLAVVDEWGKPVSVPRACTRHFAKTLSAVLLGVGFLMIGWTRRKQGLHDLLASTVVIKR